MTNPDQPFAQEGYELVGAAFEVHNVLGGGLSEVIYQKSLEIELKLREISFVSQKKLAVYYKDEILEADYIPDMVVFQSIILELKAISGLNQEHEAQIMNYMRISKCPVGYLINFGPIGKLEYKRIIISELL